MAIDGHSKHWTEDFNKGVHLPLYKGNERNANRFRVRLPISWPCSTGRRRRVSVNFSSYHVVELNRCAVVRRFAVSRRLRCRPARGQPHKMRCACRQGPKNESATAKALWGFTLDGFVARGTRTHSPRNESRPEVVLRGHGVREAVAIRVVG